MNNYNYNLEASKETFTIPTPTKIQTPPIHPPAIKEIIQNTISDPTTTSTTTSQSPTTHCLTPSGGLTTCVGGTSSQEAGADLVTVGWIALAVVTGALFWPSLAVTGPIVAGALYYDYQYGPNANAGGAFDAGLAEWPEAFEGAWHVIESFDPFA